MMILRAFSIVGVVAAVGLTGCFRTVRMVQMTQPPEVYRTAGVDVLEKEISDRDASIQTLNASVLITASTGGGRTGKVTTYTSFKGYIFVRKPRELRVILQLPVLGSQALDMVSDGQHFTLLIPPRNKAIEGSNEVTKPSKNGLENLRPAVFFDSLLVPGVAEDEFVSLTEATRVLTPQAKHKPAIEEPDYDLAVLRHKDGNTMRLERLVHFSRVTMLPFQQDIYDESGQVVTQATYDKYQDFNGIQFPTVINILRPLDEYALKVEVTKLTMNQKFENDQFELKIPPGVTVQKME
jgi:outer membrane lipoprotein-sorting protein